MKPTDKIPVRKPLMVRLPLSVHTALKVKAAREHSSVQALVEEAIRDLLRRPA